MNQFTLPIEMEELLKIVGTPSKKDLDETLRFVRNFHNHLANLHNLKKRIKSGEISKEDANLESIKEFIKKSMTSLYSFVDLEY